jgi:hypothetical protein
MGSGDKNGREDLLLGVLVARSLEMAKIVGKRPLTVF